MVATNMKLPIYRRGDTYYLHIRVKQLQIKRSLHTLDKWEACTRAIKLLGDLYMASNNDNNLDRLLRSIEQSGVRKFEVDFRRGVFKSEGREDNDRMQDFLNKNKHLPSLYASPQPPNMGARVEKGGGTPTANGLRLPELLEKFLAMKKSSDSTKVDYRTTVTEFIKLIKNPVLSDIQGFHITQYMEFLAKIPTNETLDNAVVGDKPNIHSNGVSSAKPEAIKRNSNRTIDKKIGTLRALFNYAIKQKYYFDENPAANRALLTKREKAKGQYGFLANDEICKIFHSKLYINSRQEDPDYYYTLLLSIITGCRISEITGLRRNQFGTVNNVNYLDITQSKTAAGIRKIPIPEEILKTGLLDFIADKKPEEQIFKYKLRLSKGSGNAASQKFKRDLKSLQLNGGRRVFHSIRKFTNNFMLHQKVMDEIRCQVMGHEYNHINVKVYGKAFTVEELHAAINDVQLKIFALTKIPTEMQ